MPWDNRDYYRGDSGGGGEYLGNPAALLSYSVPFGTWFGARARLHFWLLLSFIFTTVELLEAGRIQLLPVVLALTLLALMLHEFGHRFAARWVGGSHDEFMLWPAGGMIPPNVPMRPGATFIANFGGMLTNLALGLACWVGLVALTGRTTFPLLSSFFAAFNGAGLGSGPTLLISLVSTFMLINLGLVAINLLPYYWFDGGYLVQSILWPFLGLFRAVNITCIIGMVVAVPMFLISLAGMNFLGMVVWALLFADSYNRRRQLQAQGAGELEAAVAFSASTSPEVKPTRRRERWNRAAAAAKEAARERREQEKVDEILAKVHDKGMHSLSWWDRRTLRKATERQRHRGEGR